MIQLIHFGNHDWLSLCLHFENIFDNATMQRWKTIIHNINEKNGKVLNTVLLGFILRYSRRGFPTLKSKFSKILSNKLNYIIGTYPKGLIAKVGPVIAVIALSEIKVIVNINKKNVFIWFMIDYKLEKDVVLNILNPTDINIVAPIIYWDIILKTFAVSFVKLLEILEFVFDTQAPDSKL